MKNALVMLPFIAIAVAAITASIASAMPDIPFISYLGWGLAAAIIGIWVTLDWQNFQRLFQRKGMKYGASSGLVIILGVGVIVGIAVLSNRPRFNKSYDATQAGTNTLSNQSIRILPDYP